MAAICAYFVIVVKTLKRVRHDSILSPNSIICHDRRGRRGFEKMTTLGDIIFERLQTDAVNFADLLIAVCNRSQDAIYRDFFLSFLGKDFLNTFTTVIEAACDLTEVCSFSHLR